MSPRSEARQIAKCISRASKNTSKTAKVNASPTKPVFSFASLISEPSQDENGNVTIARDADEGLNAKATAEKVPFSFSPRQSEKSVSSNTEDATETAKTVVAPASDKQQTNSSGETKEKMKITVERKVIGFGRVPDAAFAPTERNDETSVQTPRLLILSGNNVVRLSIKEDLVIRVNWSEEPMTTDDLKFKTSVTIDRKMIGIDHSGDNLRRSEEAAPDSSVHVPKIIIVSCDNKIRVDMTEDLIVHAVWSCP